MRSLPGNEVSSRTWRASQLRCHSPDKHDHDHDDRDVDDGDVDDDNDDDGDDEHDFYQKTCSQPLRLR